MLIRQPFRSELNREMSFDEVLKYIFLCEGETLDNIEHIDDIKNAQYGRLEVLVEDPDVCPCIFYNKVEEDGEIKNKYVGEFWVYRKILGPECV